MAESYLGPVELFHHEEKREIAPGVVMDLPWIGVDAITFPGEIVPLRLGNMRRDIEACGGRVAMFAPIPDAVESSADELEGRNEGRDDEEAVTHIRRTGVVAAFFQRGATASNADIAVFRVVARCRREVPRQGYAKAAAARGWVRGGLPPVVAVQILPDICWVQPRSAALWNTHAALASPSVGYHCRIPQWRANALDCRRLAQRARRLLMDAQNLFPLPVVDDAEDNPIKYSFWLASNLEMSSSQRQRLLEANSVQERLRSEIRILEELQQVSSLICKGCGSQISQMNKLMALSDQGMFGNYVNPHGFMHQMVTVSSALGVTYVGQPSTESSWFQGYAWTIMNCEECESHMGWRFTAAPPATPLPPVFYGLRRSAVSVKTN